MKPQLINCGSKCRMCDGYGIMTLYPGNIKAPCLACSADKNLHDLERERDRAIAALERANVLREIDEHNKRIAALDATGKEGGGT